MNTKTNTMKGSHVVLSYQQTIKGLILGALITLAGQVTLNAQVPTFTQPKWWIGAAVAGNVNFYRGTTQELNSDLTVPAAFHHGQGVGLYLAPLLEYRPLDSRLGLMLQAGYDGRNSSFETVITPCDCKADLSTNLAYITVEPSLRFAPFKSNFYLFAGPRVAFNIKNSFTYKQRANPVSVTEVGNEDMKGDFSHMNQMLLSMQIGAGYDIPLTDESRQKQTVLSPFVSFHPYFGQNPRSIETWTVTTVRIGAAIKFGQGHLISKASTASVVMVDPMVSFSVVSPENIPVERRVRETFPLRNYVFFDVGSLVIPDRYVLLTKDQVKDFKEDQLEVFTPKRLSGRSDREMTVYYNVLNIVGDRMGKNPSATITLVGSSETGPADGLVMAEAVKTYLVDVFGIQASRIKVEGRKMPKIPSGDGGGGTADVDLLREGNRRVSIESDSPAMLMEFQSGPDALLKPVEIIATQQAPLDSYLTFNVAGANKAFSSWSLEMRDEKGYVQNFGPYTTDKVMLPGKTVLGTRPSGDYQVTMVGTTKTGQMVRKETTVHMVLWTPPKDEEGARYSVIFEFNKSTAISIYHKYLTDIVTPKIPKGATVIIHGHTDITGAEAHNQELSLERSNEVKNIIESALSKAGRSDVAFEVYGFGEDESVSPFQNNFPEERFYNRTVIIDIIPKK